mmetsp:Transcript_12390/g.20959  ORF Transcript_12390/g.20959 Transcript_12390/m.20959 type:complete len:117 (-) Transcript_12390:1167-1517(-)
MIGGIICTPFDPLEDGDGVEVFARQWDGYSVKEAIRIAGHIVVKQHSTMLLLVTHSHDTAIPSGLSDVPGTRHCTAFYTEYLTSCTNLLSNSHSNECANNIYIDTHKYTGVAQATN